MDSRTREWKRVDDQRLAVAFWRVGIESLQGRVTGHCPRCGDDAVRYYAHHFEDNRSALWVWCSACHEWSVASNMNLELSFSDPYADASLAEFEQMERSGWLDRLDGLWSNGQLPQVVRRS